MENVVSKYLVNHLKMLHGNGIKFILFTVYQYNVIYIVIWDLGNGRKIEK
jgi:hypothetical protein